MRRLRGNVLCYIYRERDIIIGIRVYVYRRTYYVYRQRDTSFCRGHSWQIRCNRNAAYVCVCVCVYAYNKKKQKKINILKFTINPFARLYIHTHIIVYLSMLFWLRFGNTRNPFAEAAAAAATAEPFLPSQEWKEKTTHAAAAHSWHAADKTQYHHPSRIGTPLPRGDRLSLLPVEISVVCIHNNNNIYVYATRNRYKRKRIYNTTRRMRWKKKRKGTTKNMYRYLKNSVLYTRIYSV